MAGDRRGAVSERPAAAAADRWKAQCAVQRKPQWGGGECARHTGNGWHNADALPDLQSENRALRRTVFQSQLLPGAINARREWAARLAEYHRTCVCGQRPGYLQELQGEREPERSVPVHGFQFHEPPERAVWYSERHQLKLRGPRWGQYQRHHQRQAWLLGGRRRGGKRSQVQLLNQP